MEAHEADEVNAAATARTKTTQRQAERGTQTKAGTDARQPRGSEHQQRSERRRGGPDRPRTGLPGGAGPPYLRGRAASAEM